MIIIKIDRSSIKKNPLPKWLYRYESKKIKCNTCNSIILHNKIELDYTDDGEGPFTTCPNCNSINSFPQYEYENIVDVIKEPDLK